MEDKTNEFSFTLKPSDYGVGVFATHDIKEGTYLRLFGDSSSYIMRKKEDVPEYWSNYCVSRGEELVCPRDFGAMQVGWYLNHSKNPNAIHKNYEYYALRAIKAGEEILIDYNTLEEPEGSKEDYYK